MNYKKLFSLVVLLITIFFIMGCAKSQEEKELSVKKKEINIRIEGAIYPIKKQIIIPSVSGYIDNLYVKNGDKVKKGDLLYTIDKKSLLLDIKSLKIEISSLKKSRSNLITNYNANGNIYAVNIAARELKKIAQLRAKGYTNKFEENQYKKNYINAMYSNRRERANNYKNLQDLDTNIKLKEIALAKLQFQYKHADMYARIDGFIAGLNLSVGEHVSANAKLGTIVNIDKVIVKAGFANGLMPFIYVGQKAHVDFITTPPYATNTYITQINPIVNPKYDRMTAEMIVKNHNYQLQNGTRALITIKLSKEGQKVVRKYLLNNKNDKTLEIKSKI